MAASYLVSSRLRGQRSLSELRHPIALICISRSPPP